MFFVFFPPRKTNLRIQLSYIEYFSYYVQWFKSYDFDDVIGHMPEE